MKFTDWSPIQLPLGAVSHIKSFCRSKSTNSTSELAGHSHSRGRCRSFFGSSRSRGASPGAPSPPESNERVPHSGLGSLFRRSVDLVRRPSRRGSTASRTSERRRFEDLLTGDDAGCSANPPVPRLDSAWRGAETDSQAAKFTQQVVDQSPSLQILLFPAQKSHHSKLRESAAVSDRFSDPAFYPGSFPPPIPEKSRERVRILDERHPIVYSTFSNFSRKNLPNPIPTIDPNSIGIARTTNSIVGCVANNSGTRSKIVHGHIQNFSRRGQLLEGLSSKSIDSTHRRQAFSRAIADPEAGPREIPNSSPAPSHVRTGREAHRDSKWLLDTRRANENIYKRVTRDVAPDIMGRYQRMDRETATRPSAVAIPTDSSAFNQGGAHHASAHTSRMPHSEALSRIPVHELSWSNQKQTPPTTANRSSWSSFSFSEDKDNDSQQHAGPSTYVNMAVIGHQVQRTVTNGNWNGLELAGPHSSSSSCYSQDEYPSTSSPGLDIQAVKSYFNPTVPTRHPPSPPLTFESGDGEYYSPLRRRSAEVVALQPSPRASTASRPTKRPKSPQLSANGTSNAPFDSSCEVTPLQIPSARFSSHASNSQGSNRPQAPSFRRNVPSNGDTRPLPSPTQGQSAGYTDDETATLAPMVAPLRLSSKRMLPTSLHRSSSRVWLAEYSHEQMGVQKPVETAQMQQYTDADTMEAHHREENLRRVEEWIFAQLSTTVSATDGGRARRSKPSMVKQIVATLEERTMGLKEEEGRTMGHVSGRKARLASLKPEAAGRRSTPDEGNESMPPLVAVGNRRLVSLSTKRRMQREGTWETFKECTGYGSGGLAIED